MYWLTRSSITFQAEMTTIDGDERREQDEPDREAVDAERVPDVEARDPGVLLGELHRRRAEVEAGDERDRDRKLASDAMSAVQRTASARSSRPNASSSTPETIGSQMAMLRRGMFLLSGASGRRGGEERPELPGHEADDADDHDQRIPVEIAALDAAATPRHAADRARRAVDRGCRRSRRRRRPARGPCRRAAPRARARSR